MEGIVYFWSFSGGRLYTQSPAGRIAGLIVNGETDTARSKNMEAKCLVLSVWYK